MNSIARIVSWMRLAIGVCRYVISGQTPPVAYQALIRLFCMSGGGSNDFLSRCLKRLRGPCELPTPSGVLGNLSDRQLSAVADILRKDGYYVFPNKLPADLCDRLLRFGLHQPSSVREDERPALDASMRRVYGDDRSMPRGVRYDVAPQDLLANKDVQDLLSDPSILGVAQAYLESPPIADVLSMWWHTAYANEPSAAAAQFYHFDMDRIKWLKFFIYLTDVGPDNGPHSFVARSHRTGGIPADLLSKGYARLTDEDVGKHYRSEDVIEFVGARGTVLVEDTRGLHKGKHVTTGDRLILQLQFSNSLFGGAYPKARLPTNLTSQLSTMIRLYPAIYRSFS